MTEDGKAPDLLKQLKRLPGYKDFSGAIDLIKREPALKLASEYQAEVSRFFLALKVIETFNGSIHFDAGSIAGRDVRIKLPDCPAIYGETLFEALANAVSALGKDKEVGHVGDN